MDKNVYPKRERQIAVNLVKNGVSVAQAAASIGCDPQSIRNWVKAADADGTVRHHKQSGRKPTRLVETVNRLPGIIEEKDPATLTELTDYVGRIDRVPVSKRTVKKALGIIGFSKKKRRIYGPAMNEQERTTQLLRRADFAYSMIDIDPNTIAAMDETGFNRSMRPGTGFAPVGEEHTRGKNQVSRGKNISVMFAVDHTGISTVHKKEGGMRREDFIAWCDEFAPPAAARGIRHLLLDNARIHQQIPPSLARHGITARHLATYSPMLNPTENANHTIKTHVRRNGPYETRESLLTAIDRAVEHADAITDWPATMQRMQTNLEIARVTGDDIVQHAGRAAAAAVLPPNNALLPPSDE